MPKKKPRSYGKYTLEINGELYACVRLPLGNGKYKRKIKKMDGATDRIKWALEQLDRHKSGELSSDSKKTFHDLAKWYQREFLIPPVYTADGKKIDGQRSYKKSINRLNILIANFGDYKLDKLTVDVLRRYKRERLKSVSITNVNHDLSLLRTILIKAKRRKWLKENPFDYGENLIERALQSPRLCPLTDRIYKRLLARSRKSNQKLLYYFILTMRHTGARPSEIMPYGAVENDGIPREPLNWKNVLEFNFKAVRLVSYKGKAKKERVVPASYELEKGLRELHLKSNPKPEALVFPISDFKKSWSALLKSCRFENIRIRDFRAFFNSKLIAGGFDEVSRLLIIGHTSTETNLGYASVSSEFIENFRRKVNPEIIESETLQ
jgi:integrase